MIELLQRARHEIIGLRRSNEILTAQVSVIETFAAALGLRRDVGMSPDIAWELERKIKELESPRAADVEV